MIHGENLILAINGTPLAASKSCSLSKSSSFIEVAPPTAGDWEAFVPSKKGWSMSSDCLLGTMDAYKTLDAAWKAGTALTIRFFNTEYDENETGTAYIDSLNLDASKGSLAKMSVSLKGSGELSDIVIPVTRNQLLDAYYYNEVGSGTYVATIFSNAAKVFGGTFTLNARSRIRVVPNGNTVFISSDSGIINKVQNKQDITPSDYSNVITANTELWLNAGEWIFVESAQYYQGGTDFRFIR